MQIGKKTIQTHGAGHPEAGVQCSRIGALA